LRFESRVLLVVFALGAGACRFGTADILIGFNRGSDAACVEQWDTPQPVTELDTPSIECGGQISEDGLTLYFDSNVGGNPDLYVARRPSRTSPFGAATPIVELNTGSSEADPSMTPDELEIYFTSDRDTGNCIYRSKRASTAATWEPAVRLDATCAGPAVGPFITADGLTLYYNDAPAPGLLGSIRVTTRATRADSFAAGAPIPTLTMGATAFGYAALSADELTMYMGASANEIDIWQSTRTSLDAPFGVPSPVTELNSRFVDGDPSVTGDGQELFFASARSGAIDLYVSKRVCR
jgi:Tol biopolymer transport system component